jgi:hypothetical protein
MWREKEREKREKGEKKREKREEKCHEMFGDRE